MDDKMIKLHEPDVVGKWYYAIDKDDSICVRFFNDDFRKIFEGKNNGKSLSTIAKYSSAAIILITILSGIFNGFGSLNAIIIFVSFLVFTISIGVFSRGGDSQAIMPGLIFTHNLGYGPSKSSSNKIKLTRQLVALLNYYKDYKMFNSESTLLALLDSPGDEYFGKDDHNLKSKNLIKLMNDEKTFASEVSNKFWGTIYPIYYKNNCECTWANWGAWKSFSNQQYTWDDYINENKSSESVELEKDYAPDKTTYNIDFLNKVPGVDEDSTGYRNFRIVASNFEGLSVADKNNFKVICRELEESSNKLNNAIAEDNEELVKKLTPIFDNLLKVSLEVVERIKDGLDDAVVDEVKISSLFLGDKFGM